MLFCGMILPFTLAFKKIRRSPAMLLPISILLNVGMWLERYMIVAPTLSLSYHPWTWDVMWPGWFEWGILFGSMGWFGMLFLIFVKVFPSVSMYEVKEMVYHRRRVVFEDAEERALEYASGDASAKPATSTEGS